MISVKKLDLDYFSVPIWICAGLQIACIEFNFLNCSFLVKRSMPVKKGL